MQIKDFIVPTGVYFDVKYIMLSKIYCNGTIKISISLNSSLGQVLATQH